MPISNPVKGAGKPPNGKKCWLLTLSPGESEHRQQAI